MDVPRGQGMKGGPISGVQGEEVSMGIYDSQEIDMCNSWALGGAMFTHDVP